MNWFNPIISVFGKQTEHFNAIQALNEVQQVCPLFLNAFTVIPYAFLKGLERSPFSVKLNGQAIFFIPSPSQLGAVAFCENKLILMIKIKAESSSQILI